MTFPRYSFHDGPSKQRTVTGQDQLQLELHDTFGPSGASPHEPDALDEATHRSRRLSQNSQWCGDQRSDYIRSGIRSPHPYV